MSIRTRRKSIAFRLASLGALSACLCTVSSCSKPSVDITVQCSQDLINKSYWSQLVIYSDGCPDDATLSTGDISGNVVFQSLLAGNLFQPVGDLPSKQFGFAVLMRDTDCSVLGWGCTPADLSQFHKVIVDVEPASPAVGQCTTGQQCLGGLCQGSSDGGVSDSGDSSPPTDTGIDDVAQRSDGSFTGCLTDMMDWAPFNKAASDTAVITGPSLTALPSGFMVTYRETSSQPSVTQYVRQLIAELGSKGARIAGPQTTCQANTASNGITSIWSDAASAGLMVMATPQCQQNGTDILVETFNASGQTTASQSYPSTQDVELTNSHGVSQSPGSTQFLLALVQEQRAFYMPLDGITIPGSQTAMIGAGTPAAFAQIVATPSIVATATTAADTTQVVLGTSSNPTQIWTQNSQSGSALTAMTAWDTNTMIVSASGPDLVWMVASASGSVTKTGTIAGGPYTSVDVAYVSDHLIIAGGKSKSITLFRFDGVSGTITDQPKAQVTVTDPGGLQLDQFDGNNLALSAARDHVVVSWVTASGGLTSGQLPGAYIMYGCHAQ